MATQLGTSMLIGCNVASVTSSLETAKYYVDSVTTGDKDIESFDVYDSSGARVNRTITQSDAKIELSLFAKADATPITDFPKGAKCVVSGLTTYYVDNCQIQQSAKDAGKVSVTLINLGF